MGMWSCLPRLRRCCFCTRKLRAACVLICIFIMFAGAHGFSMFIAPACTDIFNEDNEGDLLRPLIVVMWGFFGWTLLLLASNFFFLLAIFKVPRQKSRYVAKDGLVFCGLVWAVLTIALANLELLHMNNCDCSNHSDIIACFIYTPLTIYYMIIVNSFEDLKGTNDTVIEKSKKKPEKDKTPKEPTTKLGKCIKATRELCRRLLDKIYKRKVKKKEKKPKPPKTPKSPKTPKPPKTLKPGKEAKALKTPKVPKSIKPPKEKTGKKTKGKKSFTKTTVTPESAATPMAKPAEGLEDASAATPTVATAVRPEDTSALPSGLPPEKLPSPLPPEKPASVLPPENALSLSPPENTPVLPPEKAPTDLPSEKTPSPLPPEKAP